VHIFFPTAAFSVVVSSFIILQVIHLLPFILSLYYSAFVSERWNIATCTQTKPAQAEQLKVLTVNDKTLPQNNRYVFSSWAWMLSKYYSLGGFCVPILSINLWVSMSGSHVHFLVFEAWFTNAQSRLLGATNVYQMRQHSQKKKVQKLSLALYLFKR